MKRNEMIPLYAADGRSLGLRTREAAERLAARGSVKPAYGRKGHLKAIWLPKEDGSNPVEVHSRAGTCYSFLQSLGTGGRCWSHRPLDGRDENGLPVVTRGMFFQVLADCLAH